MLYKDYIHFSLQTTSKIKLESISKLKWAFRSACRGSKWLGCGMQKEKKIQGLCSS